MADPRPVVRRVALEYRATILIEHDISHPMQAVFRAAPMVTNDFRQLLGIRFSARQRRDGVRRLSGGLAVLGATADDTDNLLHARPVAMVIEGWRTGQRAAFLPAVVLAGFRECLPFGFTFMLVVGGLSCRR